MDQVDINYHRRVNQLEFMDNRSEEAVGVRSLYNIDSAANSIRCIEDLHNYAKSSRYYHSRKGNNSMSSSDADDDDVNEKSASLEGIIDDDDDDDMGDEEEVEVFLPGMDDTMNGKSMNNNETRRDTICDHNARRPMNAFLIFCKRHRAIVKERYKTLENRAITKILGDWWASLDENDKECFKSLALENKNAFFSANPNFKWYKLPAPSIPTHNTRPSYNGDHLQLKLNFRDGKHYQLTDEIQSSPEVEEEFSVMSRREFGQTLGDVSKQYSLKDKFCSIEFVEKGVVTKKPSRSCKGKIYQELVNSGQIVSLVKKKPLTTGTPDRRIDEQNDFRSCKRKTSSTNTDLEHNATSSSVSEDEINISLTCKNFPRDKSSAPKEKSTSNSVHAYFDLEEKIKELPALALDTYLQRKRNSKKKRNSMKCKKRHKSNIFLGHKGLPTSSTAGTSLSADLIKHSYPSGQVLQVSVVGSQKRKARKESITRRDVSCIKDELAAIMATSISSMDGHRYLDPQSPFCDKEASVAAATIVDMEASSPIKSPSLLLENLPDSTSDLLILAEVAANHTDLNN